MITGGCDKAKNGEQGFIQKFWLGVGEIKCMRGGGGGGGGGTL